MKPGYVGEPKGAAHIAFERGFFDAFLKLLNGKKVSFSGAKLQEAEAGKLNVASTIIDHCKKKKLQVKRNKERSFQEILKCCKFANEKPQLEFISKRYLEAFIRLTPKCHPEIARGGIEYAWGYSKLPFCYGINDAVASYLEENVKAALSCEILTINQICKFAWKG
jgi:predicted HicB family RNase H-like nuclease